MFTNLRYVLFEKQSNLDNNRPKLEVARFLGNPNSQFFFEELSHYQVEVMTLFPVPGTWNPSSCFLYLGT